MRIAKFSSIRLIVVSALSIVVYIVCGATFLAKLHEQLTEKVRNQIISEVEQSNEFAYWRFNAELQELESISAMLNITDNLKPVDILNEIEKYNQAATSLQSYAFVWPNGVAICDDGVVRDFSKKDFFRYAVKGKRGVTLSQEYSDENKKCNTYAVPIYSGTNVVAVLVGNKPITTAKRAIGDSEFADNSLFFVVDSAGSLITEVDEERQDGLLPLIEYIASTTDTANRNKVAISEKSFGADKKQTAYIARVSLGISDCSTIAIIQKEDADSIIEEQIKPLFLIFLMVLVILIGFSVCLFLTRLRYKKSLMQMVYRDQLTGLMNWNAFLKKYEELHSKSLHSEYTLVLCDIDGFKMINDVYGQREGNRIIKLMADVIKAKLRPEEYFARVSADNFVILLHTKEDEEIIRRITDISDTIHNSSLAYAVMTSFGIYKISGKHIDLISIHDRAKLAKNMIKGNHQKTYIFYDESLRQNVIGEKEIENEMERALGQHQFKLYLQPKYSFGTDEIVGAEALVRWEHPEKGIISPGVFIPIFERNEFVRKLDFYIYESVCEMLSKLDSEKGKYKQVPISVNFSRVHLNYPDFSKDICTIADKYQIKHQLIEIELTESVAINDKSELDTVIDTLRKNEFVLAIDDFGSGYSSLNILKDLNINVIKFDMEFLKNSTRNPKGKIILKNLVRMAKELQLITVAEGVETIEQVKFLKSVDCDIAQGYFYARPMPMDYFVKLVAKQ